MSDTKSCPKCGQKMAKKSAIYAIAQRASEDVMMEAGLRLNPERTLDIVAFHCWKCSFVEFYAADYFTLELDPPSEETK